MATVPTGVTGTGIADTTASIDGHGLDLDLDRRSDDRPTDRPAVRPGSGGGPAAPALRLADVGVGYGGAPVLSGVSFAVEAGRWLAVIGPNGAGKSTLLKAIVGAVGFDGTIELEGRGRGRGGGAEAHRIGYVPQQPILPLGMTTAEYVLLGRTAHLGWFRAESGRDRRRVADVLEQLDLGAMAARPVTELSGGEAQRASLARALVQEASVLVLDEPISALDLAHQISVLELVDELRRTHRLAVVTAMHDLTIAGRFADRLLLVADRRQQALGSPEQVLTAELLTRQYRTPVTVLDGPDGGIVVVPLRTPPGLSATPTDHRPPTENPPPGARHAR